MCQETKKLGIGISGSDGSSEESDLEGYLLSRNTPRTPEKSAIPPHLQSPFAAKGPSGWSRRGFSRPETLCDGGIATPISQSRLVHLVSMTPGGFKRMSVRDISDCFSLPSGQVRPREGTEICNFGAPPPLEALHWIFCFFSSIYSCNLVRRAP